MMIPRWFILASLLAAHAQCGILPGMSGPSAPPGSGPGPGQAMNPMSSASTGPQGSVPGPGQAINPLSSVDPTAVAAAAAMGVDPNTAAAASLGMDPSLMAAAKLDPNLAAAIGLKPNFAASAGPDPNTASQEPGGQSGSGPGPGQSTNPMSSAKIDPGLAAALGLDPNFPASAGPDPNTASQGPGGQSGFGPGPGQATNPMSSAKIDPSLAAALGLDPNFPASAGPDQNTASKGPGGQPGSGPGPGQATNQMSSAKIDPSLAAALGLDPNLAASAGPDPNTAAHGPGGPPESGPGPGQATQPMSSDKIDPSLAAALGFDPNLPASAGPDPNAASQVGVDPKTASQGGLDPDLAAALGLDQKFAASVGVDPNAPSQAGVDPNAASQGGLDPNFAAAFGIDQKFAASGRIDPNAAPQVGLDQKRFAASAGVDPNAVSQGGLDQNLAAAFGLDQKFAASIGVDPNAASRGGFDQNIAASFGVDPNAASRGGFDQNIAASIGVNSNTAAQVGLSQTPAGFAADPYAAECRRQRCREPCHIPHPSSCFKFIVCQPLDGGRYIARDNQKSVLLKNQVSECGDPDQQQRQRRSCWSGSPLCEKCRRSCFSRCRPIIFQEMLCAFGTMWKVGAEAACDVPQRAGCINDRCKDPSIISYAHEDKNCRTFWRCENGRSVAGCCGMYQRYVGNGYNGTCVDDIMCDHPCPLLNDASCQNVGVKSLNFPDGNCKTHFDCANGQPHPVCCADGQGYDVLNGVCVRDPTCNQPCPIEYQGMCSKLNISSYPLMDGNCRTYMKCNALGQDEPHCCRTGHMYDRQLRVCRSGNFPYECENANCPRNYIEECGYMPVPNDPFKFRNLDAHGGQLMACAVGTKYNQQECRCSLDPDFFLRAKIASRASTASQPFSAACDLAIDVNLPNLQNHGTAAAAILMIGDYGQGEKGVGNMDAIWTGQDGINIPYYGGQELPSFFLEMAFTPTELSPTPQILLSSCFYDQVGVPSLEIRLLPSANNTGTLNYNVVDKLGTSRLQAAIPYQVGVPYIYRVVYDGKRMGVHLEQIGGTTISDSNDFTGLVPIHRSGLRFAHCRYETDVLSFIGSVRAIKFSRCINDMMMNMLYPTPAGPF